MAVYRNIQTTFWTDAKVADEFTPEDKFFYLYLFTNPHTNLCGCYEISKKQMSWETGYSIDTIDRLIDRFEKVHGVIKFSPSTKELLIINWHKYNWTSSEKFRKPLYKQILEIKNNDFKNYLKGVFGECEDTVSIPYQYGIDTTVTASATDTVSDTDIKDGVKIAPSLEEVKAYCKERNNNINPQRFIDYYTEKEWMHNGKPIKDWKARIRNWETNNIEDNYVEPKKNRGRLKDLEKYYLSKISDE